MNYPKTRDIINKLPVLLQVENTLNSHRIYQLKVGLCGEGAVVYFIERELRIVDNFALNYAVEYARKCNKHLKIVHVYKQFLTKEKKDFYNQELEILKKDMESFDLDFQLIDKSSVTGFLNSLSPKLIVVDFNPIREGVDLTKIRYSITEIDGHNIIPARYVSDKQEYNAFFFRKKVYDKIYEFFTDYPEQYATNSKAFDVLQNFILKKLEYYAEYRNDPNADVLSQLSPYLNFGFISSQRVALEIYKSDASIENKEAFLEELIVRKELADNFCLYNKNYKSIKGTSLWAKRSLLKHKNDFRPVQYSIKELENANTEDEIWNAAQRELLETGKIHGYLRMYWAKKLLFWTESPADAIEAAIYLNDKYAFDAPSPNGYVGILWAIAGLHDRAFREEEITGKIRRMSYNNLRKKINSDYKYIRKNSNTD